MRRHFAKLEFNVSPVAAAGKLVRSAKKKRSLMDPVEKFGEFIVTKLRDRAIEYADGLLAARWKSPSSKDLQSSLAKLTQAQRALVRRVVIDAVDGGIHDFLFALDEIKDAGQDISIIVDNQNVAALSDGLHGEPYTDEGWFARYSKHGSHPDPT
ncbi:MAG: hypothetical protein K8T89_22000 [Planctomycetes bacterium]|nr:hypothetical protein [Planctomycetota bacterium]